ncbi:CBS domain-containing protein [Haloactinomyces albus]|uniref:CBS domain-containing protein n=1 Tax=Haloactinomyces albus TaxID=1352928 RepID=A0AAE3ZIM1_9ACTN|nr:CBS domain-containing protein [Haloactinomyces albus]MDR7304279.1 CBS domain-containing protein [Haloactinomyces albus]
MTSVREIMTVDVECIDGSASLADAAYRMSELEVGALPICDVGNRLRGILTERDIVVKCLARGADPFHARAGQCAEGPPATVQADDPVEEVVRVMSERHIRRLVVLDGGDVVGMIGEKDLVRGLTSEQFAEVMRSILEAPASAVAPLSSEHDRIRAEGLFAHFLGRLRHHRGEARTSTAPPR